VDVDDAGWSGEAPAAARKLEKGESSNAEQPTGAV